MFHKSALIVLALIPFLYMNNIRIFYRLSLIPFAIVLMYPETIAEFLVADNEIYLSYGEGTYYLNNAVGKPYMIILLISFFYVLGWIFIELLDVELMTQEMKLLSLGCAFTFMLTPLIWSNPAALRVVSYFGLCMAIFVGYSITEVRSLSIFLPLLFFVFCYHSISKNDNYHFMWENMKLPERYVEYLPNKNVNKSVNIV